MHCVIWPLVVDVDSESGDDSGEESDHGSSAEESNESSSEADMSDTETVSSSSEQKTKRKLKQLTEPSGATPEVPQEESKQGGEVNETALARTDYRNEGYQSEEEGEDIKKTSNSQREDEAHDGGAD